MRYLQTLKNSILWKKISYSNLYQRARFPNQYIENRLEYNFYRELLGTTNEIIFDVGANTGEKAAIFKRLSKKVICFEPSPASISTLEKRFALTNVAIIPIALSEIQCISQLYVLESRQTLNSISKKQIKHVVEPMSNGGKITVMNVKTETLDIAIQRFGRPTYIKIDVEGHEKEVIAGLTTPVKYLSFENCSSLFLEEGIASINHLQHISNNKAVFNISVNGNFIFKNFSIPELIKSHLEKNGYAAAEVYCKSF